MSCFFALFHSRPLKGHSSSAADGLTSNLWPLHQIVDFNNSSYLTNFLTSCLQQAHSFCNELSGFLFQNVVDTTAKKGPTVSVECPAYAFITSPQNWTRPMRLIWSAVLSNDNTRPRKFQFHVLKSRKDKEENFQYFLRQIQRKKYGWNPICSEVSERKGLIASYIRAKLIAKEVNHTLQNTWFCQKFPSPSPPSWIRILKSQFHSSEQFNNAETYSQNGNRCWRGTGLAAKDLLTCFANWRNVFN